MTDADAMDERLRAVERALTESDRDLTDLRDAAELAREVESLAARLNDTEDRLDELDAATQALRGYVGSVRAVNEEVERRADAALATAESLEEGGFRLDRGPLPDRYPRSDCAPPLDSRTTCDCERRRPESFESPDDEFQSESDESRGLLARLAEALS